MRKNNNKNDKSMERKASKILAYLEKSGAYNEESPSEFLLERSKLIKRSYSFAFVSLLNLGFVGYSYYMVEQEQKVSLYASTYKSEIEKLEFLPTRENSDGTISVQFSLPYEDDRSIKTFSMESIKRL